jgi:hypothetical protein
MVNQIYRMVYVLNLVRDYKMKASLPRASPVFITSYYFYRKNQWAVVLEDNENCKRVNKYEIAKYQEWAEEKFI